MRRAGLVPFLLASLMAALPAFAQQTDVVEADASVAGDAGSVPPPADATSPAGSETTPLAASPDADAGPGPGAATSASQTMPLVALVDAAPLGVDPAAGAFVTDVLRQSLGQLGYATVPVPQLYEMARRLLLPFPVPPEGLHALLSNLGAPLGATAEVRAGGGYYQVLLRVRFANEPAERFRQILATQWTLGDSIRAALPALLAPPGSPGAGPGEDTSPLLPDMSDVPVPRRRRPPRLHPHPWDIAVGAEIAVGPGVDAFLNFLAYGRVAYFPLDRLGITASVAYGNFRGRTGRVSNVLPMLGLETAVDVLPKNKIYMPLRGEIGYLPFNGVVVRGTAGIAFPIARGVRVELDVLTPTIWFLPGISAVSFDFGAQIVYGAGARPRRRSRRPRSSTAQTAPRQSGEPEARANEPTQPGAD